MMSGLNMFHDEILISLSLQFTERINQIHLYSGEIKQNKREAVGFHRDIFAGPLYGRAIVGA